MQNADAPSRALRGIVWSLGALLLGGMALLMWAVYHKQQDSASAQCQDQRIELAGMLPEGAALRHISSDEDDIVVVATHEGRHYMLRLSNCGALRQRFEFVLP